MLHEFDNTNYNFSRFQQKFIKNKEVESNFDKWVHATLGKDVRNRGWICLLWYTADKTLHSRRVGLKRLLGEECTATN